MRTALAETVHWLLYASLVLVPLSGWLHHASSTGFAPIWWPFGQTLPFVPISPELSKFFAAWHWLFTKILFASVVLHIVGALKHVLIDRDGTLARMTSGREAGAAEAPGTKGPIVAATAIWASAIAAGSVLGTGERTQVDSLSAVASDWEVQSGAIEIDVLQLGSAVQGSFSDWTAAITFNEDALGDQKGTVDVTISIPSLSLGGVTQQAMGADFFAAETHPTATFQADLVAVADAYEAQGTLTIKGNSVPLTLPFTLDITDGVATVDASTSLDRREFNIGESYKDESRWAFQSR